MRPITNFALHSILAVAIAAFAATGAAAAGYLKLGDIKGQASAGSGHGGEIHVESFSWGATQAGAHGTGGGGGAGKVHVHDISMAPSPDAAKGGNVEFEWKVEEGESAPPPPRGGVSVAAGDLDGDGTAPPRKPTIGRATISPKPLSGSSGSLSAIVPAGACKAGARYPTAELGTGGRVYKLTGVVVTGCTAASAGGSIPTETLSLNFDKVTWK